MIWDSVAKVFERRVFGILARQVYQYTSNERLIEVSAPALAIIKETKQGLCQTKNERGH